MAGKRVGEYAGTASGDGGEPNANNGPIAPASIAGTGSGGDGGNGDDNREPGSGDDFLRNADGSIRRNKDGTPRRKRGRKATAEASVSVVGLEKLLMSFHTMAAVGFQAPEMVIDNQEANMMATAIAEVNRHYPVAVDPGHVAIAQLVGVSVLVYGPRAKMIVDRKRKEREERRPKPQADPLILDEAGFLGTAQ